MIQDAKRVVVKVGTSSLTYENGKLNLRRMETLCKVLTDLQNAGRQVVLVTSGAIGVGMGKLGQTRRPTETEKKQALAAVGQCELMFMYDKLFGEYNQMVAQVLLTGDVVEQPRSRRNVENTFRELIELGIIPVVNENDTVAIDELVGSHFGDNDTLSAVVAQLVEADALVILTDIDGLYDSDRCQTDSCSKGNHRRDSGTGRRGRLQPGYRRHGHQNQSRRNCQQSGNSLLCGQRRRPPCAVSII